MPREQAAEMIFGRDILPAMLGRTRMYAYDYHTNQIPEEPDASGYWRDVGTLDAYYEAQMDLCGPMPALIFTTNAGRFGPPAILTRAPSSPSTNMGSRVVQPDRSSLVVAFFPAELFDARILGRSVKIHSGCLVEDSILFDNCTIGANCRIRRAIIDENVEVPDGECIGYDLERDRTRHHISDTGIIVVTKKSLGSPLAT